MIAIFKREIMNYLKRPLFWVGVLLVIYGVFNATSPYLTTHYLTTGEKIINDQSNTSVEGEVYEGYIPATPDQVLLKQESHHLRPLLLLHCQNFYLRDLELLFQEISGKNDSQRLQ